MLTFKISCINSYTWNVIKYWRKEAPSNYRNLQIGILPGEDICHRRKHGNISHCRKSNYEKMIFSICIVPGGGLHKPIFSLEQDLIHHHYTSSFACILSYIYCPFQCLPVID